MNVVREIERINKAEIERIASGTQGGSWHDQYKDSAHIFIGGLPTELTEGDVITIFSQYGEPVDINLPRDKSTGKTRGFGFLMYEDQRSTVLAVDNLNGAKVLNRTLRVDHVQDYKHLEEGEDGKFKEAERETFNARPDLFVNQNKGSGSDESEGEEDNLLEGIDPDDPMAAYLISQRKEERALAIANGSYKSKKSKHGGESKEERRRRKEERRRKREEKERRAEGSRSHKDRARSRSRSPDRSSRRKREDSAEERAGPSRRREDTRDYEDRPRSRRRDYSDDERLSGRRDVKERSPRDSRARPSDPDERSRRADDSRRRRSYTPEERDYRDRRRRERSDSRDRDRY